MKDKNLTTFYIARHVETQHNVNGIIQGHIDSPITQKGHVQGKEFAKQLKKVHFDKVYSSDILRAKKTAEFVALEREMAVETTKLLRERSFGEYEGASNNEYNEANFERNKLRKSLGKMKRMKFKLYDTYESDEEIAKRLTTFIREVAVAYPGKKILMVSHGSIMRMFLVNLGFGSYDELSAESIENTGYFVLDSDGVDFFVKELWKISKLEK